MNTEDHQEHQVDIQEKSFSSFFFRIAQPAQSCIAWCMEHKQLFLLIVASLIGFIALCVYGVEKSRRKALYNLVKAEAMVQELRQPLAHAGEQEKKTPSYQEIDSTLSASRETQERFNGVLFEEKIIAKKELQENLLKNVPYPLREWTWTEVLHVTEQLEHKDFATALSSIQALLQGIAQNEKESLYPELVGYLHLMEENCLKALNRPTSESSVEFEKWKNFHPDLAQQISSLVPRDENLL